MQDDQTVNLALIDSGTLQLLENLRASGLVTIANPSESQRPDQTLEEFVKTLPITVIPTSEIIIDDRLLQAAQLERLQTDNPNQYP
jgi:hypothetical protein